MKTETDNLILRQISEKSSVTVHELTRILGISPQALHRHLIKLQAKNLVIKSGSPPKVFYSLNKTLEFVVKDNALILKKVSTKTESVINDNFLYVSASGEMLEGENGFKKWCEKQNLPIEKTAGEYVKTFSKYKKYFKNGLISGMYKMKTTFKKVWLDEIYYLDFYSIERFGKTKLGNLLLYAKQSQDIALMDEISNLIKNKIEKFVCDEKIDAVGFVPPTVKRQVQFQKEMERLLGLNLPKIKITKVSSGVVIAQKTLSKLEDRIENAIRTNFIEGEISYRKILLIDDAVGSGATMNEIAGKIKEKANGETKVIGLAITGSFKGFEIINEV